MSDVRMKLGGVDVEKTPVTFTVTNNGTGEVVGHLQVSRGGLRWKKKRERKGKMISWQKFADLVEMLR
jgi:hypothetical protein